ncbi:MAG: hypothetical protein Q9182_001991 [Xanthomendoza sp. 2 TL-2023]
MQPAGATTLSGDVYVLDGDKIIGLVGALKFQCIPRQLLNTLLPPRYLCPPIRPGARNQRLAPNSAAPRSPSLPEGMDPRDRSGLSFRRPKQLITDKTLDVIASELGVPARELADSIEFAKLGVDSLMSLSIVSRMRIDLEIEVQSSLFTDYPTVRGMKGFLSQYDLSEMVEGLLEEKTRSLISDVHPDGLSSLDGQMATPISLDSVDHCASSSIATDSESLSMIVRETISKEMGVDISELFATDDLASLGMDSLMTSTPHFSAQERVWTERAFPHLQRANDWKGRSARKVRKLRVTLGEPQNREQNAVASARWKWNCHVLCVPARDITRDDRLGSQFALHENPEEYRGGISGIASKFIAEIKRRQPQGPYNIGGWSAGGITAYEMARQMTDADN